ncbi:hypothetical protein M8J77_014280 [Diaphorina citri]|nr:hypothetical protein M8J77_014280 [Diaphorina citri]
MLPSGLLVGLGLCLCVNHVVLSKVTFNMTFFEIMKNQTEIPVIYKDSYETDYDGNIITVTYPYNKNATVHYYGPDNQYKPVARAHVKHLSANDSDQHEEPHWSLDFIRFYSQRFCAFSHRVHLILYANNITHDTVYINTANKPKWFLDRFFPPKVPLIQHMDIPITDSLLICDYLNTKHPGPRPLCHQDAFYQNDDNVMLAEEFEHVAWGLRDCLMVDHITDELYTNLTIALKWFERELTKRQTIYWFGNEYPGMTDYMMWPWFERMAAIPVHSRYKYPNPLVEFPRLLRWEMKMLDDTAVKYHYQPPESYVEYFRRRRKGIPLFDPVIA